MKIATIKKQPNERRRYGIDYSEALDAGDLIVNATTAVSPSGLTATAGVSGNGDFINLVCEGGTDGQVYKITMTVTTTDGNEIIEDEITVRVKEI